jgi:hypothetical protein
VGRVDDARQQIDAALKIDPRSAEALRFREMLGRFGR